MTEPTIYLTIYSDATPTMPSFPITFYRPPAVIIAEVDEFLNSYPTPVVLPVTPKRKRTSGKRK